jgi:hypothetical protein
VRAQSLTTAAEREGERSRLWQPHNELLGAIERLVESGMPLAVGGDPLGIAVDAVLVGAVCAEVLARDMDAVAVDRAGIADVGLLLGLGPVPGECCGAVDSGALGGKAVQRVSSNGRRRRVGRRLGRVHVHG